VTDGPTAAEPSPPQRSALTAFQIEVARAFFALDGAKGFLLAGGAALAAQGLTARPTQDLDLFTAPQRGTVSEACAAFEHAAVERGWGVRRVRDGATFVRLVVTGLVESVVVDLAVDAAPQRPATTSIAGPTLDPEELAGRKVIALFDRAEARDFADVHALAARYGTVRLLELAAAVDRGFDEQVFADMLDSLARFTDEEIPVPAEEVPRVRRFAAEWAARLRPRL
jgi:hypothetical protein